MRLRRTVDGPFCTLVALLLLQLTVTLAGSRRPPVTDELYWLAKARYFAAHHRFAPVAAESLAAERGAAWGVSDWRPQLLTVVAALLGGSAADESTIRPRLTLVVSLCIAAILVAMYLVLSRTGMSRPRRFVAAVLLGGSPWVFGYATEIGPDGLNEVVTIVALLLLWRWIRAREPKGGLLFAGAVVMSATLLLRPDMIVMAPLMIAATFLLRRPAPRDLMIAGAAFVLVLGAQVTYRTALTGSPGIFGRLALTNRGLFRWIDTWFGTEKEAYDFVYALTEARPAPLPDRAFANADERRQVEAIVSRVLARKRYTAEDDAAFQRLADARTAAHPIFVRSLRLWHAAHLWLNLDEPTPLLQQLARLTRAERRPLLAALLVLKLAACALAAAGALRSAKRLRGGTADDVEQLVALLAAYVVTRTLLVGAVLNWKVARYVLSAWPPLLGCACGALRRDDEALQRNAS